MIYVLSMQGSESYSRTLYPLNVISVRLQNNGVSPLAT